MATIHIADLHSAGSALFLDEESFLNELSDTQAYQLHGGSSPFCIAGLALASPELVAVGGFAVAAFGAGAAFSYAAATD